MRKELLAAALSLSLVACVEKQTKASEPKQETKVESSVNQDQTDSKEILKQYRAELHKKMSLLYDFSKDEFLPNITDEQKAQFIDLWIDRDSVQSIDELNRFDRLEDQPRVEETIQLKKELEIQKILDKCVALIGTEENDKNNFLLYQPQGIYMLDRIEINFTKSVQEFLPKTAPNYLTGRVQKCATYLYGSVYSLKDFEYHQKAQSTNEKDEIEQLYQQAYLEIKAAGLLRNIREANYPKSLVRTHADESGLSRYIQEQEAKTDKQLDHKQLAIDYFGSYEKWIKSLNDFINKKMS